MVLAQMVVAAGLYGTQVKSALLDDPGGRKIGCPHHPEGPGDRPAARIEPVGDPAEDAAPVAADRSHAVVSLDEDRTVLRGPVRVEDLHEDPSGLCGVGHRADRGPVTRQRFVEHLPTITMSGVGWLGTSGSAAGP